MDSWDDATITEGYRALDLFVDRAAVCRRFLGSLNDDLPPSGVLYLHGDGGNGKSLLLDFLRTRLCKRIAPDNWAYLAALPDAECVDQAAAAEDAATVPVGRLDFTAGPRTGFEALPKLRRDLAGSGLRFPVFDFAVLTYLQRSRQSTDARRRELFPAAELDLVADLAEVLVGAPGAGMVANALAVLDRRLGGRFERYRQRRGLDAAVVEAILRMDHETELIRQLPRLFAADLNAGLGAPGGPARVALFVDGHEALWGAERDLPAELYFGRDEWLRRLLRALDRANGVVAVVAGREPPRWPDAPSMPFADLDLQPIGDLADADALDYLGRAGVRDAGLRRRLCDDARVAPDRVHPFALGLGADLVLAASRAGAPLTEADLDLGPEAANRRRLIDRLLRYVGTETRDAVVALSACRAFDAEVYRYLGQQLGFRTSRAGFAILTGFSFVRRDDAARYRMHELLRRVDLEDDADLVRAAHGALERYHRARAAAGDEAAIAEAIYHANRLDWRSGFGNWFVAFEAAFGSSWHSLARALLDIRAELVTDVDAAAGMVSATVGRYLHRLGRYDEARAEHLDAVASFDCALVDEPDEPGFLSNKGNALVGLGAVEFALGRPDVAEVRFLAAAAALRAAQAGGEGNPMHLSNTGDALLRLGEVQARRGDPDAALASYAEAEGAVRAARAQLPREAPLLSNLGNVRMHVADLYADADRWTQAEQAYRSAIRAFDAALRLGPDDPIAHNNRGSAFHRRGKMYARQDRRTMSRWSYRAAIGAADAALRIAPEYLLALSNKGMYCEELGWLTLSWERPWAARDARRLYRAGRDAYAKAADLAPDHPEFREAAARLEGRLQAIG